MSHLTTLSLQSKQKVELIDITNDIDKFLRNSHVASGVLIVYTPHTTAGITINENADPSVKRDIREFLLRKVPHEEYFHHMEGNSPSHIMSSLISASETLIIQDNKLLLGTWQGIFFAEFDGPRTRNVHLKIIEE